jgi:hypothetical protein
MCSTGIVSDIVEINQEVCRRLWKMVHTRGVPSPLSPHLICPEYASGSRRVSEQEARFAYAEVLTTTPYYYSVETPTKYSYSFSGTGERSRSAQSDMSLYRFSASGANLLANVELKAGNPVPGACGKDIQKLVREDAVGNWFHVFGNADSATVPTFLGKIEDCFKDKEQAAECTKKDAEVSIVFCVCVMDKRWACIKHFEFSHENQSFYDYVTSFFRLDYSLDKGRIVVKDANGWTILRGDGS